MSQVKPAIHVGVREGDKVLVPAAEEDEKATFQHSTPIGASTVGEQSSARLRFSVRGQEPQ